MEIDFRVFSKIETLATSHGRARVGLLLCSDGQAEQCTRFFERAHRVFFVRCYRKRGICGLHDYRSKGRGWARHAGVLGIGPKLEILACLCNGNVGPDEIETSLECITTAYIDGLGIDKPKGLVAHGMKVAGT